MEASMTMYDYAKQVIANEVPMDSVLFNKKTFEVEVVIDGLVYAKGVGPSKKEAEQDAARIAFNKRAE